MFKFFCFFLPFFLWAQDQSYLYSESFLGEKDFSIYFGPFDPSLKKGGIGESSIFVDDSFKQNYLRDYIGPDAFNLLDFIANDLPRDSLCSNYYLDKNAKNIKYLFRLLTLSYLFETLKAEKILSYNLGFGDICSLEWEETFQNCKAREIPMANFIKRIKGNHLKDFSNKSLIKMKNDQRELWLRKFHQNANSFKELDLAQSRILYFCRTNNLDCKTISFEDLKFAFQLSCSEDQNFLLKICSNTDELYGLSYVKEAPKLIEESSVFAKINEEGYGKNCIKRFINVFKSKEMKNPLLSVIFPKVEALMIKENRAYKQGSLFVYGALDDFEKKGLEEFLFTGNEEIKKPEPAVTSLPTNDEKIENVEIPTLKGLLEVSEELKKISKIDPSKTKSFKTQFMQTEMKRFMADTSRESIDMGKFKKETTFLDDVSDSLQERIYLYERKSTFEKLKGMENLGKFSAPLPLSFLKYMIDFNEQQPLNNLLEVLGEKFFIINDLEHNSKVYFIQLVREADRWQIYILKAEKETNLKFK